MMSISSNISTQMRSLGAKGVIIFFRRCIWSSKEAGRRTKSDSHACRVVSPGRGYPCCRSQLYWRRLVCVRWSRALSAVSSSQGQGRIPVLRNSACNYRSRIYNINYTFCHKALHSMIMLDIPHDYLPAALNCHNSGMMVYKY